MKFIGELIAHHLRRYPRMELADVYKLLHQAAMGSGHAVGDSAEARAKLEEELTRLEEGPDDPVADPISPDGKVARIHLRPYVAAGHNVDLLLDAFIHTAQAYPGAPDRLERFCACLGDVAAAGGLPYARNEVESYVKTIAARGYPVVHHSDAYRSAYRPAYRVVGLDLLPALHRI